MRPGNSRTMFFLGLLVVCVAATTGRRESHGVDRVVIPCVKPKTMCDPHYSSPFRGKIIGGEVADPGSTPWLVSLQDTQFMNPVHFCGATLLNIVWVLTSANCVSGYSYPYETLQVVLGEYDMEEVEGWERTRTVSVIVIHSDYDPFSHANDIALIRIHTPVLYNERIRPINLPPCRYEDDFHPNPTNHYNCWNHDFDLHKVDEQLLDDVWHVITGWGRTAEANDMSSVVMKATVPLLSQAECAAAYPSMPLTQSMICAGNLTYGGLDPCQGDWGGPLISSSGYIRGVSSWGVGCGRPGLPAIYTDVAKYNNWICDIIVN